MANYTTLSITAFGEYKDLVQFDAHPPKCEIFDIEISSNLKSRNIYSWFNSKSTSEVIHELIQQIFNLSLLIDIEIEPGYNVLLYRRRGEDKLQTLFEIPDYRDDEFFENVNPEYLNKFDKIHLDQDLIEVIEQTFIGKIYLDLLINRHCCINI